KELEHSFGHPSAEFGPAPYRVKADRKQHHGERDDQQTLHDLVHGGGGEAAHHDVPSDDERVDEIETERTQRGDTALKFAAQVALARDVELRLVLDGEWCDGGSFLQFAELTVAFDGGALLSRPLNLVLHHEGGADLVGDEIAEADHHDHRGKGLRDR